MFHAFDSADANRPPARQEWMAVLARAPLPLLEVALAGDAAVEPDWLRRPETGLMMIQGRAGGTGDRFNLGEVTVTRCALRPGGATRDAAVGVAYVLGRDHRQARLAALADAFLQDTRHQDRLQRELLDPARRHLAERAAQRQARAQSTRVEFFTVARESSGGAGEEDEA